MAGSIKNITRSGTTFTATKNNNSTFTFSQQDNNNTYDVIAGIVANASFASNQQRTTNKVSAPSKTGYHFVAWIGAASSGWVDAIYPESYDSSSTYFWTKYTSSSIRYFHAYCIYMKNT